MAIIRLSDIRRDCMLPKYWRSAYYKVDTDSRILNTAGGWAEVPPGGGYWTTTVQVYEPTLVKIEYFLTVRKCDNSGTWQTARFRILSSKGGEMASSVGIACHTGWASGQAYGTAAPGTAFELLSESDGAVTYTLQYYVTVANDLALRPYTTLSIDVCGE